MRSRTGCARPDQTPHALPDKDTEVKRLATTLLDALVDSGETTAVAMEALDMARRLFHLSMEAEIARAIGGDDLRAQVAASPIILANDHPEAALRPGSRDRRLAGR